MSVIRKTEHGGCPDCAYFKDCPENYSCPFKVMFEGLLEEPTKTAMITINGYTFLRSKRNELHMDNDYTNE